MNVKRPRAESKWKRCNGARSAARTPVAASSSASSPSSCSAPAHCSSPASHRTTTTTTSPTTTTTAARRPRCRRPCTTFSPVTDPSPAGVSGKPPTLVVPPGAPPTKPELANLITGTGPGASSGRQLHRAVRPRRLLVAQGHPVIVDLQAFSVTVGRGRSDPRLDRGDVRHEGRRSPRVDPAACRRATASARRTASRRTTRSSSSSTS